jgi:hypothetical protein
MSIPADAPADPVARVDGLIDSTIRRMLFVTDANGVRRLSSRISRRAVYGIAQTAVLRRLLDECATDARSSPH